MPSCLTCAQCALPIPSLPLQDQGLYTIPIISSLTCYTLVSSSFEYVHWVWFVPTKWPGDDFLSWFFVSCFSPPHHKPSPGIRSILLFDFSFVSSADLEHKLIDENGKQCQLSLVMSRFILIQMKWASFFLNYTDNMTLWIPETGWLG